MVNSHDPISGKSRGKNEVSITKMDITVSKNTVHLISQNILFKSLRLESSLKIKKISRIMHGLIYTFAMHFTLFTVQ